ncbi:MAG TPA: response regulator transcription factor [Geobacteraceae bacterium]|nr:response regulator transcription factor [Geobacteraceae bacterium]
MKILVIEDEKKVANFIKRGLEEEKFEIDTAYDGETGTQKALDGSYDLIILDVMLPKKDGIGVVKELRARKNMVPVLILSAKDSLEDIVAGLNIGSDDYLVKPFAFAELAARVKAILRRSGLERGAEIRYADLRLDPVAHKVWRKDKEIELTAKEYALLEFFVRNPNQVITRATIAEHVWADTVFDTFTNIIDVYINYLRKKIDRDTDTQLIHTVRGLGYIFKKED